LGKIQGAIAHYTKAIELSPNYSEAHNNLGNALLQQGKLSQAVSSFERALEIKPDYAEAHNNLGVALARQGRLNEAIVHFSESVRLEPNYAQARANLELALQEAGKSNLILPILHPLARIFHEFTPWRDCDNGYGRPLWRPRMSAPAAYRSGTSRGQSRGTAGRLPGGTPFFVV
jgi:Flp pilus assembly protein TadD